ncbi:unnamed protein product [Calypogeia fissa]
MGNDPHNFWRPLGSGTLPAISSSPNTVQKRSLLLHDLLPGIPNKIALRDVSTKLSWKDFHVLSAVSRGWRHAIRGRDVYNARVLLQTRETLALIYYGKHYDGYQLALYSLRDGSSYLLPSIPGREAGLPEWCECVSVDGRIYVIGGVRNLSDIHSGEAHVLDLAGQVGWKLCAGMGDAHYNFHRSVLHGKIYVFEADEGQDHRCGEVYDPKTNTWSPFRTPKWCNPRHKVESLQEQLFLFTGRFKPPVAPDFLASHPVKEELRKHNLALTDEEHPFVAQGKLHSLGPHSISVYNSDRNSWSELHTFSFAENVNNVHTRLFDVQAVDEELFALWGWSGGDEDGFGFLQSKGFGGDTKEILWEKVPLDFATDCMTPILCSLSTVQL